MLFLGIGNVHAQGGEPQTVIIKVLEFPIVYKSQMFVTEPNGTTKITELKRLNYKNLEESISFNSASIQTEINLWKKAGYEISGMSNSSIGDGAMTTIILSKKE